MVRVQFKKGKQREFIDLVILKTNSPSLRGLLQFGLKVNYSTLKNYHNESRLLPEILFRDLCSLSGLNTRDFDVKPIEDYWGQIKGGKAGKRKA